MEKMNRTAVDQILPTPALTNSKICAGVNPQIVASTSDMGMFEQTRQRASALTFACTPGPGGTCAAAKLIPLDMEDADKFGSYAIRRRDVAPSPLGKAFWETMREYAARELRG